MSSTELQIFYVGESRQVRDQLAAALSVPCEAGVPGGSASDPAQGSGRAVVVFLDVGAGPALLGGLPGGNAFTACRDLKDRLGVQVYLLVAAGDQISPEIGRFCLADGSLEIGPDGLLDEVSSLVERIGPRSARVSVDALLENLERAIGSDEGRQASAIQRMLADGDESTLMDHLVDSETGLFDGPYASFKLDEEFKRSRRFHQPLSLMLLDVGTELLEAIADPADRKTFLAEVSSVFLNECRDIDVLARFTASTFMILMPGTGSAGAEVVAARMLAELAEKGIFEGREGRPHCGLATMPSAGIADRSAFMARAEARLQMSRAAVVG